MNMENWWNDTGPGKKSTSRRILSKHHFVYHQSHKPTNDQPCEPWHGLLYDWHSRVLFLECMNLQATKSFETLQATSTHPTTRRNIPYEYSYKNGGQRVMSPNCLMSNFKALSF